MSELDLKTAEMALYRKSIISREGYEFDPDTRRWQLSRDVLVELGWAEETLADPLRSGFLMAMTHIAQTHSAHHVYNMNFRSKGFFSSVKTRPICQISAAYVLSYRASLDKDREYFLGMLSGFLKLMHDLGFGGIDNDARGLLDELRLKGNEKGAAVQTMDPETGALSDLEYEAFYQALVDGYERDSLSLSDYFLVMLFLVTGRRPAQIADLKIKDLVEANSSGDVAFIVNVPRRKQRGGDWREEFKPAHLMLEYGFAFKYLADTVLERVRAMGVDLPSNLLGELPLFPKWKAIKSAIEADSGLSAHLLRSDAFHQTTTSIGAAFKRIANSLGIHSERTGKPLHVFPTRLRRTLATRAAREGYGVLVIAELLDHSDTQNAGVYIENVPEHVDAINRAMAMQLAPYAQAFAGVLVDREEDAVRGDDMTSRVRTTSGSGAGTCGHHGFCGAMAPIACYTCKSFQPWLDGPHEEVLDYLLADRERIMDITQDQTMAAVNDRTIFAVSEVIQRCANRREELVSNG